MNRNLEAIAIGAAQECTRQQVDEGALVRLLGAHDVAMTLAESGALPTLEDLIHLGQLVEPRAHTKADGPLSALAAIVRRTPVTFRSGGTAAPHGVIVNTLDRMFAHLDRRTDADEFTKALLDVHPFSDGNGRTAWLIYNWLMGSLGEPLPLPDYYGEVPLLAS